MKTRKKKILIYTAIYGGITIFCLLAAMRIKWEQTGKAFVPETILVFSTILCMSVFIGILANYLIKYFKNKPKQKLIKQIIPAFLIFYIGSYIIANLSIFIGVFFWFIIIGRDLSEFIPHTFKYEIFQKGSGSHIMLWLFGFTIIMFYILWRKAVINEQKLEEEKLKFQYRTLKNQVNPHFLFNSLNTLSSLIQTDIKASDKFINNLSDIYRYILDNEEKSLISLEEELRFVQEYFNIQKTRDEEKISLQIVFKNPDKYQIIPVSLQVLIENAIKHNSATRENPLNIKIYQDNDYVVVENNLQMITKLEATSKTGLQNLKERVRLITSKELEIEHNKQKFTVKLPIIMV